jgi:hypothetical protein
MNPFGMSDAQSLAIFLLVVFGTIASLGDYITTSIGVSSGKWQEANPVAAWLQKKLGMALAAFLATALYIFTSILLLYVSTTLAFAFAGSVAGLEVFNTIRNYRLNKSVGL